MVSMNFIKSLFSKKTILNSPEAPLSPVFAEQVKYAISLLSNEEGSISDEEVLKLFDDHKIAPREAVEICLFLPIAFVRHWLPNLNWPDSYQELIDEEKFIEKKYSKTLSFKIIWEVTNSYFQDSPSSETVIKIGGRSAEFHAINQLLNDNDGDELENIQLAQTVIIRQRTFKCS